MEPQREPEDEIDMAEVFSMQLRPGNQVFTCLLGEIQFKVQIYYRDVESGGWYFDLIRFDSGVGLFGLPVLPDFDALAQFQHLGWGHLSFTFDSGLNEPLSYADMDERVTMNWSTDAFGS